MALRLLSRLVLKAPKSCTLRSSSLAAVHGTYRPFSIVIRDVGDDNHGCKNSLSDITRKAFENTPFSSMVASVRKRVLNNLARDRDHERSEQGVTDADMGEYANIWKRTDNNDRVITVESKTAIATFQTSRECWQFTFRGVSVHASDELHMSFLTPTEVVLGNTTVTAKRA